MVESSRVAVEEVRAAVRAAVKAMAGWKAAVMAAVMAAADSTHGASSLHSPILSHTHYNTPTRTHPTGTLPLSSAA